MLQNATLSGNQRPDLLTSLINMSLVLRLLSHTCHRFWKCCKTLTFCSLLAGCTIPCACHAKAHLNVQKCSVPHSFLHFWLRNVLRATTACTFSTSQLPKVLWTGQFFALLRSKGASRHNGVHFFRHLNFQEYSEPVNFLHFWLRNMLRATTACTFSIPQLPKVLWTRQSSVLYTFDFEICFAPQRRALFSTSQLPKMLRTWGVFILFTCKCASRHNGVQFFISHLSSWLRTRRFSEPTFRPSRATNHWKNSGSRLSYLFGSFRAPGSSLFWDFLFFIFFLLLFSSLLWLLPPLLFIYPYCQKFDF